MTHRKIDPLSALMGTLFQAHPWHGVLMGTDAPQKVTAFIEMVPSDTVKYEVDKATGHLSLDRPQKYSNICPSMYGFIPKTLCGEAVAARCADSCERDGIVGDDDPIDICVLTEKQITHGNLLVQAIPIGGFRMIDGAEADDKIIAVLAGDAVYGRITDIQDCPEGVIGRLRHYFLTYKDTPGSGTSECEIVEIYGVEEAHAVIQASSDDYQALFGGLEGILSDALTA